MKPMLVNNMTILTEASESKKNHDLVTNQFKHLTANASNANLKSVDVQSIDSSAKPIGKSRKMHNFDNNQS
jgi:hypothetical protein